MSPNAQHPCKHLKEKMWGVLGGDVGGLWVAMLPQLPRVAWKSFIIQTETIQICHLRTCPPPAIIVPDPFQPNGNNTGGWDSSGVGGPRSLGVQGNPELFHTPTQTAYGHILQLFWMFAKKGEVQAHLPKGGNGVNGEHMFIKYITSAASSKVYGFGEVWE